MCRAVSSMVLCCCLAVGCASPQPLTATVRSASVGDITSEGLTLKFNVDVHNPNSVELPISSADYAIKVVDTKLIDGRAQQSGSIPANGSLAVTIPVALAYERLLTVAEDIRLSDGDLPYAFDGGLSVGGGMLPMSGVRVPLHYQGVLPLHELAKDPRLLLSNGAGAKLAQKVLGGLFGHE